MAHDVFISHSSKDKMVADAICAELESNNIRCWIAPRDILPGQVFQEAIIDALNESKLFIFVFSRNANDSTHAIRELSRAADKNITILPFRTEDVSPCKTIEYILSTVHWLDALTPPLERHIKILTEKVKLNLSCESTTDSSRSLDQTGRKNKKIKSKNSKIINHLTSYTIIVIFIFGLIGSVFYFRHIELSNIFLGKEFDTNLQEKKNEWETDSYIGISIPEKISGTLIAEKNYDINLEIKNNTSMQMYIARIVVEKFNKKAAKLFGLSSPLVHVATAHGPFSLKAHETISVKIVGNQILPNQINASIFHNLSDNASIIKLNTAAVELEMPAPRLLADKWLHKGLDGLLAIEQVKKVAEDWSVDAHVFAAFPAEKEDYVDDTTSLKVSVIQKWVVTFYSPEKDSFLTALVGDTILDQQMYPRKTEEQKPKKTDLPRIGNQEALSIANTKLFLCGNWNGPRLNMLERDGHNIPAWFLAYRGPDGAPLIINAITGKLEQD